MQPGMRRCSLTPRADPEPYRKNSITTLRCSYNSTSLNFLFSSAPYFLHLCLHRASKWLTRAARTGLRSLLCPQKILSGDRIPN